ncbi:polysaccharide biosynthesis/export family protein [Gemmatimonadota bacterium]
MKTVRVRQILRRFVLLLVFVCLSGCAGNIPYSDLASLPQQDSAIALTGDLDPQRQWIREPHPQSNATFALIDGVPYYRMGPGDILEMEIYLDQQSTILMLQVNPAGDIQLPAHLSRDRIHVAGSTTTQAEEVLKERFSASLRNPQVSLAIETFGSSFVTLLGEVDVKTSSSGTGEGRYAITERTTLLDFILIHASFTDQSDITSVMVTDATGRSGIFDLSAAMYAADQSQNPLLDRGDNILVPSTAVTQSRIFVLGEVEQPSLLQPRTGMTILDAISEAGGPTDQARQKWVTLVRGRGVEAELYKVPFRDIIRKGDMESNITLMPGDIIHLSASSYDSVMMYFRDSWSIMQTAVIATILIDRINP